MKKTDILIMLVQFTCAAILLPEAWYKLQGHAVSIDTFTRLSMEPVGRYIIGFLELLAGVAFLTRHFAAWAATLTIGIMTGAIIGHITVLGPELGNDGGLHLVLLTLLMGLSLFIAYLRRAQLPIIGTSIK